jgi:hypothetical protein
VPLPAGVTRDVPRDLFTGRGMWCYADDGSMAGVNRYHGKLVPFRAEKPDAVFFFDSFLDALDAIEENGLEGKVTAHRVEHLTILQSKFSY